MKRFICAHLPQILHSADSDPIVSTTPLIRPSIDHLLTLSTPTSISRTICALGWLAFAVKMEIQIQRIDPWVTEEDLYKEVAAALHNPPVRILGQGLTNFHCSSQRPKSKVDTGVMPSSP